MMKVYIAEKPSLGKAIAAGLARTSPIVDRGREFQSGSDWTVCWAAGHIFRDEPPDFYIDAKFPGAPRNTLGTIRWSLDHLPIQPGLNGWPDWELKLDNDKKGLFNTIEQFVKKADIVVNAGDVDREGQRLIDEILEELHCTKPIHRVLVTANDAVTVDRALKDERNNTDFKDMSASARARSHADWYVGMNLSRLLTLVAQRTGYKGKLPYGRVQIPVLYLIVKRDLLIEHFKPVDYFAITADMQVATGRFKAKWKPHEGQAGLDEEGRLVDQNVARQLQALVKGQQGRIANYEDKEKSKGPPLPFSIDTMRILGIRKYGLTADEVTKVVQALYDAKYVTYPRSDCAYLPTSQHGDAPRVLAAAQANLGLDTAIANQLDTSRRSKAWNDGKVTAHHGIIPTGERVDLSTLPTIQASIYREIALRYAAQFMPDMRYRAVSALVDIKGQHFTATGSTVLSPGWKALYGGAAADPEGKEGGEGEEGEGGLLPPMKSGEAAACQGLDVQSKKTTPPAHFTEDTLLEAMAAVHKYVEDERIREIFKRMFDAKKDGDEGACGLGTAATRQTFVPKLVESGFLSKEKAKGKSKAVYLISTRAARAYIQALPRDLSAPDMTALWETALGEISEGRNTYEQFMGKLIAWVDAKMKQIQEQGVSIPADAAPARAGDHKPAAKRGSGKASGKKSAAAATPAGAGEKACPECGRAMRLRESKKGKFWGCSGWPDCHHTEDAADAA